MNDLALIGMGVLFGLLCALLINLRRPDTHLRGGGYQPRSAGPPGQPPSTGSSVTQPRSLLVELASISPGALTISPADKLFTGPLTGHAVVTEEDLDKNPRLVGNVPNLRGDGLPDDRVLVLDDGRRVAVRIYETAWRQGDVVRDHPPVDRTTRPR
jgi:hypothetical protein